MEHNVPADYLLVSDLDDTFLGDMVALQRLGDFFQGIADRITVVYASGRFFESVARDIETTPLPEPVAVIGGVGSEIRRYPGGELDQAWIERISSNWSSERVRDVLADEFALELQAEEFQSEFKVSYFLRDASQERLDRMQAKLFDAGVDTSLVYSSRRDLDVLPDGVNKGTAAAFIARELGFDAGRVIVAGNSGNDAKLFQHDFYGIIVANAHDELKQFAEDPKIYLSPHSRADGVLDGLQHWLQNFSDDDSKGI